MSEKYNKKEIVKKYVVLILVSGSLLQAGFMYEEDTLSEYERLVNECEVMKRIIEQNESYSNEQKVACITQRAKMALQDFKALDSNKKGVVQDRDVQYLKELLEWYAAYPNAPALTSGRIFV